MNANYRPALYELMTPESVKGDVAWYVEQARRAAGPVLELGAGTGRVTLPIAESGAAVHALDLDDAMLEVLRRKLEGQPPEVRARVTILRGDMRDFDMETRFALVAIPFRAFLHNLTHVDRLACLRCVHRHLRPGGWLALNVFHPSLEFMSQHAGPLAGVWRARDEVGLPDGGRVLRSEADRYDTVRKVVHSRHRFERFDASGKLVDTHVMFLQLAYLYEPELRSLLAESGFEHVEIFGGFDESDFAHDRDELVVRARRAR